MEFIKLPANYEYVERYIPPRCRKERERIIRSDCEVNVPSVAAEEAPVAFRHKDCWFPKLVVYRWWNGRLYHRIPYRTKYCNANGWYPLRKLKTSFVKTYFPTYDQKQSKAECLDALNKESGSYLIINRNEVWHTCGEPRYVIMTFGLGGNHASTALMIDNEYNRNIPGARYFNALDRDAAVKEAVRVALARGDTDSVASIKRSWKISVLIPEAVHCDPSKEAGPGDPFLNKLENLTEVAKDPIIGGLLVIAATHQEIFD